MVEFAIVSLWLFALIFMIIEGAFAVRARSTMANAIDDAARRGAIAATAPDADFQILNQLVGRGAGNVADIEYVSIFRTTDSSAGLPANCDTPPGVAGECNVYPAMALFDTDGNFTPTAGDFGCTASLGTQWCTAGRGGSGQLEFIGVHVEAEYRFILKGVFKDAPFQVNVSGASLQALESSGEVQEVSP